MVKVDLITGFLGSGKTTFLINYAKYLIKQGQRIGILEYDYGAVNVDMLLLNRLRGAQCELEMIAASCDEDCLRRRFKTKLIAMAMSGYDRVIIEPSGIFDMDMFFDALREEPLENWYEIGSVITVVNANLSGKMSKEEDFFLASQIASAGSIVFSRIQLSNEDRIANTKAHIEKACNDIKCSKIKGEFIVKDYESLSDLDYQRISDSGYYIGDYIKTVSGETHEFSSVYFLDLPDNLESIKKKIAKLFSSEEYGNVIRVKGFVYDDGAGYQINASQYEMLIDRIAIGKGVIIVIGNNLAEDKIKFFMENNIENESES